MPRTARIVVPEVPHHITQRGNNKQDIFFVDDDRYVYLELLGAQGAKYGLHIDGYCLMTNHVHIIGTPATEDAIAKAMGRTHFLYTQYINRMHHRSGHLWQNRFYSCAMEDDYFLKALCYVERNPVRAGLADYAWDYAWSSARAHCGDAPRNALLQLDDWRDRMPGESWREVLESFRDAGEAAGRMYCHTNTGRPLGSDNFLSRLEVVLGRRVRPLPIGRPKGWRKKK
ncbi:MAG: transposase [Candidatus Hydrogenedentes bacterium]|nr:transposase [Candidatus Hydrogenedentota bacterium]